MPLPQSRRCMRWECHDPWRHRQWARRCARCAHQGGSRSCQAGRMDTGCGAQRTGRARAGTESRGAALRWRTFFVTGILGDKDVDAVARALAARADAWILCGIDAPRGLTAADLQSRSEIFSGRQAGDDSDGRDAHGCSGGSPRRPHRGLRFIPHRGSGAAGAGPVLIVYTGAVTSPVKERLTGALILIVAVVIVVPELFSGRSEHSPSTDAPDCAVRRRRTTATQLHHGTGWWPGAAGAAGRVRGASGSSRASPRATGA